MLVITGATGNIGSKVTGILLARGQKVKVVGRNAEKLKGFVDKGAEAAEGDLKGTGFLTKALSGASAVFAMIPPHYTAPAFRAYQNEIGASIATAIRNSGITHVVNLPRTKENTRGTSIEEFADTFANIYFSEK
jgi:uncharacterized protein YbjT (DUF2867 family)